MDGYQMALLSLSLCVRKYVRGNNNTFISLQGQL